MSYVPTKYVQKNLKILSQNDHKIIIFPKEHLHDSRYIFSKLQLVLHFAQTVNIVATIRSPFVVN